MLKPIALVTSAALLFTGCHSKSPTWQKVMATPRATGDAENRDRAYAAELHRRLGPAPHKIVTYEVDHFSKLRGSLTIQRTAVFYFDPANQRQPWWVMDHGLEKPVWVPNDPLPRQVSFFARRPVRIVEVHDYTVARDKVIRHAERERRPVGTSTLQPVERVRAVSVEEPREPKRKWRLFGRSEPKKGPAVSTLQPASETRVEAARAERVTAKPQEKAKRAAAKPKKKAEPAKPAPPAAEKKPAQPAAEEPAKPADDASPKAATEEKPAPAAEPRKRPLLFNRESNEPAPANPPKADGAAIEPRRSNLFQRILGTLNPARWFRKAA